MMTKMVNMKMTEAEQKKASPQVAEMAKGPEYPWGLRINLDNVALDRLGVELPAAGESMELCAIVKVVEVHASENETSKYKSCCLQITDLQLETEREPIQDRIYNKKSDKE